MNDISCKQCGEPYSAYALRHDVAEWDNQPDDAYEKFMSGDGCPTCDWGDKAGDVSRSRTEDSEETEARHLKEKLRNTDDDPIKYL
jgi:hypothetical protein